MTSLFDKKHNKEMLNEKSAVFRLIHEEPNTMSSWVVGPYMKVENAGQNIKMLEYHKGSLEQRISSVSYTHLDVYKRQTMRWRIKYI